jgi:hypothetical protein
MPKKDKKQKIYNLEADDNLEKIEEDIITAANKAGKKNVIVNIFSYPHQKLKKRWNIRYKFNIKHLYLDLTVIAGILVLIGLNIFWLYGGFHYFFNKLDLNVTVAQEEVISGDQSSFTIQYNNRNKFELEDVDLSFEYPQYFQIDEVSRDGYDFEHNILKLGDLSPGANGQITITGQVLGSLHETQGIYVFANFYKTNKKGERLWGVFRQNALFEYEIKDSLLKIETDLPEKLVNNQVFEWPIKILNTSEDITYEKVKLMPFFDDSFVELETEVRDLIDFAPGTVAEFIVKAKIKTDKTQQDVGLEVVWERDGWQLTQAEWKKEQVVVDPKFSVKNKIQSDGAVDPGEWVDVKVEYLNDGEFTLENVELKLKLIGSYWHLYNIKKENGALKKNVITWTAEDIPRLELLQPGEGGEINLSIKTNSFVSGSSEINLRSQTSTQYKFNDQEVIILDDLMSAKLNSNLAVTTYPMYYTKTGDQLGRGPLPAKVGETTKYWVFARLINDISAVENVKVSMQLPFNVSWNDRSSVPVGNSLQYDAATKTVSWEITKVPVKPSNIGFAFEVGIVPTAAQLGKYPTLLQNIKITGVDINTGEKIEKNLGGVSSQLNQDNKGKLRDGVVR